MASTIINIIQEFIVPDETIAQIAGEHSIRAANKAVGEATRSAPGGSASF